jgi:hypothetical protein
MNFFFFWFVFLVGVAQGQRGEGIWCGDRNCYDVLGCDSVPSCTLSPKAARTSIS